MRFLLLALLKLVSADFRLTVRSNSTEVNGLFLGLASYETTTPQNVVFNISGDTWSGILETVPTASSQTLVPAAGFGNSSANGSNTTVANSNNSSNDFSTLSVSHAQAATFSPIAGLGIIMGALVLM